MTFVVILAIPPPPPYPVRFLPSLFGNEDGWLSVPGPTSSRIYCHRSGTILTQICFIFGYSSKKSLCYHCSKFSGWKGQEDPDSNNVEQPKP